MALDQIINKQGIIEARSSMAMKHKFAWMPVILIAAALAQTAQTSSSLKSRHWLQWPIRSTASASTSASRRPPSRPRSSTW